MLQAALFLAPNYDAELILHIYAIVDCFKIHSPWEVSGQGQRRSPSISLPWDHTSSVSSTKFEFGCSIIWFQDCNFHSSPDLPAARHNAVEGSLYDAEQPIAAFRDNTEEL